MVSLSEHRVRTPFTRLPGSLSTNIFPVSWTPTGQVFIAKRFSLQDDRSKRKYENESLILQRLQGGKRILTLHHTVHSPTGDGWLLTEQLSGDLLSLVEREMLQDQTCLWDVFSQICEAVQYCHQNQVAHLDLKPENIFFRSHEDGRYSIKLADFGMSRLIASEAERLVGLHGTVHYSAPEVLTSVTGYQPFKADIWSLGVTLHVLLTGYWPFLAEDDDELRYLIAGGQVNVSASLPRFVQLFIESMLTFDPNRRPDIHQVIQMLNGLLPKIGVSLRPSSPFLGSSRHPSRSFHVVLEKTLQWLPFVLFSRTERSSS